MSTAGVVIIGNEVLSGKVTEENARFFIARLRALGVALHRVVFIRDDVSVIANDVRELSDRYDHVFTAGGVGSTHDDVTMRAVASAFGRELEEHPALIELFLSRYPTINETTRRQAMLPRGAELVDAGPSNFPVVKVENVYVFPGVPTFLRSKFMAIESRFLAAPFVTKEIFLNVGESKLADILAEVDRAHPAVEIGSYPRFDDADYRVKVTLESRDAARVDGAWEELIAKIPGDWIVRSD